MRILVTVPTDSTVIDHIMCYCWQHERHGIHFCAGARMVPDGAYLMWRILCEPSAHVDLLLIKYSEYLAIY